MGGGGNDERSKSKRGFSWDGGSGGSFNPEDFNKQMGADIQQAYKQGPGDVFGKPLYAGMGSTTKQGLQGMVNTAKQNQGMFQDGIDYTTDLLGNNGFAGGQQGNVGTVNGVGDQFGDIAASAQDPSLTEEQLMGVATGGAFGQAAPGYDRLRSNIIDDTLSGVSSLFTSTGRYGGGSHVGTATESLADSLASLDYQNYQNDIARQERALAAIEGQRQQGLTNRMGALGAQADAAQNAFGMEQQGVANAMGASAALPGLYDASQAPWQTIFGAGQAMDADQQAKLMADYELHQRRNNRVFDHLAQYQGLLGGAAQTAEQTEEAPWWQQALGAASVGAGIFGNIAGGWSDIWG